jgi:TolB-like protein/DNA-binding winged helix-turn-helix (wHTH) protein/Tfp pilus assembly protein PilF
MDVHERLRFAAFELDLQSHELLRNGRSVKVAPQALRLLEFLAAHPGRLVTREEIRQEIWSETTFVDFEQGINKSIRQIRDALNDDAERPRFIETLPRRGYRFIANVESPESDSVAVTAVNSTLVISSSSPVEPASVSDDIAVVQTSGADQPSRRFGGTLGWPAWTAIVLVGVILGRVFVMPYVRSRLSTANDAPAIQSVAVLPLENLSGDPNQEYFADGMTDELITKLAQIHSVRVISRNSVMPYKRKQKSTVQIGHELQVDAIVEGTVMRSGNQVRITTQLIDTHSDRHLWAETYEHSLNDVLVLQDEVASAIANQIKVKLDPVDASRLANAQTIDNEAYDSYLKGRYFWSRRDPDGLTRALHYFQQAVEKDPNYAPALTGLADTYSLLGAAGFDILPASEAMEKARAAAKKALSLDDGLAEAHASLGFVLYSYDWDWVHAEQEFKRAIALQPSYATAHQWYSQYLSDLGHRNEALMEAQTALRLDPLSLIVNENVARIHYFARDFERAVEGSRKTLEMDPTFSIAHLRLGRAYAAKSMYREAVHEFEEFARLSGDSALATASIGNALARSGNRSGAIHSLTELQTISKQSRVPSICFALIYVGLGDKNQAIAWLEKSYQERSDFLRVSKVDPLFDSLRDDARFQDLLRRIGFPQ